MLPEQPPRRRTPQSLPLRERVWLAQRIALARFLGIPWAELARLEGMSERTLRYHLARWREELEQEQEPASTLLAACEHHPETAAIARGGRHERRRAVGELAGFSSVDAGHPSSR